MSLQIRLDSEECMSSGRCVADLPAVFRFDEDEIAQLVPGTDPERHRAALVAAVRNCPAGAISLAEDGAEA